ncbi:hypothetical protein S4054249_13270 [Pseudoalteromonas luteoviolacea]|uniref:Uncharacterized protein n=1 Tax=Pseudoalteromonas luteoviolacea S4054 TaxID=1129367 RepID=A0A0F6A9V0_9GAMM|nr:hypothetical protein S4054249_13270 [Pseudoalteromonas luteoviolacea]AOT13678.1 hypothetical protein S40542_13240 [Pseudoalteromonas luteoviolacea]AOT18592.1 hypothetical protein S4054_13245 [Pseudoalteromonas luteoviolacea]KKE82908.1 hypothetical protein N479_15980 [Pseudoalteromonas luteoviolacea S4054]KZN72728.1 hypothetical protein N481_01010 [Pseudoalteromonas luteoviolacea S4047-1]
MSEEEKIEFKYGEPLNTILFLIILILVSAVSLFLYFQITEPSESSFLYGLNQFYQLGVLFVVLLAFILLIARPLIRLILIKTNNK